MRQSKPYIEVAPEEKDIGEISAWLEEEYERDGEGFYCNWDIIYDSFQKDRLIALKLEDNNIGFVIWSEDNILVDIDILAINLEYRSRGFGSYFYKEIFEYFRENGFMVVKLFCEPKSSLRFWKSMGLQKVPYCGYTMNTLTYYGLLIESASGKFTRGTDKIELWDVEPYKASLHDPKWTWYITANKEKLDYPIIHPCNCNWFMRWSRNDNVIKEDKVKHFTDVDYNKPFLVIERISF
jgi:GNAT superfamily N-acetyltransferase